MSESEWELASSNSQKPDQSPPQSESEWELHTSFSPGDENYWESLKSAPGRIGSDVGSAVMGGINAIPGYWEKAKTEIPGIFTMGQHPFHAIGQGLAGANEALNAIAQFPLNVSRYGSERLKLTPQSLTNALQKITPKVYQDINQLFGEPQYAGEAMLRGALRNAPTLYGATKLATSINPSTLFTTKKSIKNQILNTHDALENRASDSFKKVSEEVNNRGATQVPLTNPQGVSVVDFNNLKSYFPSTKQYNSLLNKAQTGDYNALRKLQTNLYEQGKKNLGSSFEADRMKGHEMLEKRNDINQAISDHLVNSGNTDLADMLQGARNDWSTLQKTYYNENMNNALVNMVNKNFRKIPDNLVDILGEQSIPMQNLLNFHPGLESKLKGYKIGQNVLGKTFKYGIPAGTAYLGYEYGKRK